MIKVYKEITSCRICGSPDLTEVISVKEQYLSPRFVTTNENNSLANIRVPQTLVVCDRSNRPDACGLLQLRETVEPDYLYREYFYRSGVSDTMRKDLKNVVDTVLSKVALEDDNVVVDIGANDCTMISYFPSNLVRIGVEPAQNIDWTNVDSDIRIVNDYFFPKFIKRNIARKKSQNLYFVCDVL